MAITNLRKPSAGPTISLVLDFTKMQMLFKITSNCSLIT